MSSYLAGLERGDEVEVRGPMVEYALTEGDRRGETDVLFLAGGTGVSSALQAVHCFLEEGGEDRVRILWANRRREDCVGAPRLAKKGLMGGLFGGGEEQEGVEEPANAIVREIRELQAKYPGRVEVQYFVDEEGTFITSNAIREATRVVDGQEGRRKLLMASGPDGFMEHFVGKKGDWLGTQQQQGQIGGVVKSLGLKQWEVVKL